MNYYVENGKDTKGITMLIAYVHHAERGNGLLIQKGSDYAIILYHPILQCMTVGVLIDNKFSILEMQQPDRDTLMMYLCNARDMVSSAT